MRRWQHVSTAPANKFVEVRNDHDFASAILVGKKWVTRKGIKLTFTPTEWRARKPWFHG